jgi:hypothetical protein
MWWQRLLNVFVYIGWGIEVIVFCSAFYTYFLSAYSLEGEVWWWPVMGLIPVALAMVFRKAVNYVILGK